MPSKPNHLDIWLFKKPTFFKQFNQSKKKLTNIGTLWIDAVCRDKWLKNKIKLAKRNKYYCKNLTGAVVVVVVDVDVVVDVELEVVSTGVG